jgi:hypothetical protein
MSHNKQLTDIRLQLHQAAQLLAALGISYLERKEDDSHTNMGWNISLQSLQSHDFGPQNKLRLLLNFPELQYRFYDDKQMEVFTLHGKKEADAVNWIKNILEQKNMDISRFTMKKHYEIPVTAQGRGQAYDLSDKYAFKKLSSHFDIAQKILTGIAKEYKNTSTVRCWPHHFDLGMLITLQDNKDAQQMKSIGIGLSPGDSSYDQPYYYVSPWPYPDKDLLNNSDLTADSFWHTEGFISAIFLAPSSGNPTDTENKIIDFLTKAIQVCKKTILNDRS